MASGSQIGGIDDNNPNAASATSGSGGASSGAGAADGSTGSVSGNNALTGPYAKNYTPIGAENVWQNPWMVLQDVFGKNVNTSGSGYQGLRNLGADPLTLFNMMAGRGHDLAGGAGGSGTGDYINWLGSLYKTMGQTGGRAFSASELLHNLFNPQGGAAKGGSALQIVLEAGDGNTQMRTLFNMAKDATNVGMNPLAARGYQSALSQAGDQAMHQFSTQNVGTGATAIPVWQLMKQIMPGLVQ